MLWASCLWRELVWQECVGWLGGLRAWTQAAAPVKEAGGMLLEIQSGWNEKGLASTSRKVKRSCWCEPWVFNLCHWQDHNGMNRDGQVRTRRRFWGWWMDGQGKIWLLLWKYWHWHADGTFNRELEYAVRVVWEIRIWVYQSIAEVDTERGEEMVK